MTTPEYDRLLLEATIYVLGDMSSAEGDAFEARLSEDQVAREALAEAVLICQVTTTALAEGDRERSCVASCGANDVPFERLPASSVDRVWRRPALWAGLAIAASVAIVVGVSDFGRPQRLAQQGPEVAHNPGSTDETSLDGERQLAVAWLNSTLLADLEEPADANDADDATSESDEVALVDSHGELLTPVLSTEPDWLFEAVTTPPLQPAGSSNETPQEG
ncbi:MAG TPA: hypothetical protein VFI31_14490 [Pirellulales bacterium]|nr:hypothetical protein [Pirellulales bacterium]